MSVHRAAVEVRARLRSCVLVAGLFLQSLDGERAAHATSRRVERRDDALGRESGDTFAACGVQVLLSHDCSMVGERVADDGPDGVE